MEKSTAVTCWPRAARSSECLPVPQAISSAGPAGRSGKSSRTMLAGSEGGISAASLCLASQSDWLEGIKKLLNVPLRSPKKGLKAREALAYMELDAKRAAAAAGALHLGTRNGRQIDHKFSWPPLAGVPAKLSTSILYQNFQTAAQPHVPVMKRPVLWHFDKPECFAYNKMQ